MKFDPFVLPFTIGLVFMSGILLYRYINWTIQLLPEQRHVVKKNFLSLHTIFGLREVFYESLLHKKIFKKNRLLGYMHMSLAFGWFLLIIVGHFETSAYFGNGLEAPYVPIFLRYFQMDATHHTAQTGYWFLMDTILLFVLSGVFLAWYKRRRKHRFGLIQTTKHTYGDRMALTALWFIFPLRLLAESISSILYGGGSYLTFGLGSLMEGTIATWFTLYTAWWAYSISLGIFFVSLPFSRYMHIPTEVGLIMLRHWGATSEDKRLCGMSQFEINSCSSCGICLDACQLISDLQITNIQTPYLFKSIRSHSVKDEVLNNCLMCGRCINPCVVGINTTKIRQVARNKKSSKIHSNLNFLDQVIVPSVRNAEVIYFAGCMSHLTPGIKKSMATIFAAADVRFALLDEYETICCGRPMMLSGMTEQAEPMIRKNKEIIKNFGSKILVTSCPICYKVFKEEYNLGIEVLHHTQFIDRMVTLGRISLNKSVQKVSYHDPCELGRGSGIYEESRNVLRKVAILEEHPYQKEQSLCCGGSIANSILTSFEKRFIARSTFEKITTPETDALITSCPLCKKTFAQIQQNIEIKDIAEFIEQNLTNTSQLKKEKQKNKALNESTVV